MSRDVQNTTGLTTASLPRLDPEKFMRDMNRMVRNFRRNDLTIDVVQGHIGPPNTWTHPTDGRFIECSYEQAKVVETVGQVPLRLLRVVSTDRAQFTVATPLCGAFTPLTPPPYHVTEREIEP